MSVIPRLPMIPNLTEPDLSPTEGRSPLPAAFGRIDPTAIAFIFVATPYIVFTTIELLL